MSAKYVLNMELFYSVPVTGRRFSDFRLLPTEFSILKQCHFLCIYTHILYAFTKYAMLKH